MINKPTTLRREALLAAIVFFGFSSAVAAQTNLESEQRRQQERERLLRERFEYVPDVRLLAPGDDTSAVLPAAETPCFTIQEIVFESAVPQFLPALQALATDPRFIGQCLGIRGINTVMGIAQNRLIADGYVTTRVLAPPQDLKTGSLRLHVIPGRVRDIRLAAGTEATPTLWNALPVRAIWSSTIGVPSLCA